MRWFANDEDDQWRVRWEQVPQQTNSIDCGVAMLMAMRRRLLVRWRPRQGQGWGYTARDFEGMRWKMANELANDRVWLMGDETMAKMQRVMTCWTGDGSMGARKH